MSQKGAPYGLPISTTTRSGAYNRTSRPIVTVGNNHVSSLARAIESGSMNLTTGSGSRFRASARYSQPSPERTGRANLIPTQRTRLPSQDRSNILSNRIVNSYNEPNVSYSRPTFYTVTSIAPSNDPIHNDLSVVQTTSNERRVSNPIPMTTESKLIHGGLYGLQNLGNTCFMNSVLQCLSNTKPLLLFCLQDNLESYLNTSTTSVMKGVLMKEYASLIRKMWLLPEGRSVVSPLSFKNTIGKFAPRFTGYSEQDSQEFLRYLLQGLSEDVNRVRQKPIPPAINEKEEERMSEEERAKRSWERCLLYENSQLVDIFAGQLKSTLECSYCRYQSITFDMFWDLSLPLPRDKSSTNLQDCIQLFMSEEELDGDEKPMCARCKQKRPCKKKLSIQKCPEILVLHLKRFSQMRSRTKLNTHVDFPINNLKLNNLPNVMSRSHQGQITTYNLFGISNHSGTIYTGHYTAQCKHPFTHEWHEFNDSNVYTINDDTRIISPSAYVLFYERNRT